MKSQALQTVKKHLTLYQSSPPESVHPFPFSVKYAYSHKLSTANCKQEKKT